MRSRIILVGLVVAALVLGVVTVFKLDVLDFGEGGLAWLPGSDQGKDLAATYIGGKACAACHSREYKLWFGSHHDLAMQVASEETVLGDFKRATLTHFGVESTFFRRDGNFYVRTEGPDGSLQDYQIAYTFGAAPLQQYLVQFPGGRYQALGIAWDSRPSGEGGQRWFHLYPNAKLPPGDPLHWTGRNQTWNYMCAECHSTDLKKNYDLDGDRYQTTWSDIDVSCEACHGAGSVHIEWAKAAAGNAGAGDSDAKGKGLIAELPRVGEAVWKIDANNGIATRSTPLRSHAELETCAHCHSRRRVIHDDYVPGRPLLDTHQLSLLEPRLYHADGQMRDEVYVYGSFLQSKMYRAGVTCSDCHEPHSLEVRAPGNQLCAACHAPDRFDTPTHHFHKPMSQGARCVACHMPPKTYMVVDPRRDHSFRVPRPDLSEKQGVPNACNTCHQDRSAGWAAEAVAKWHGHARSSRPHFGAALQAGRRGGKGADAELGALVADVNTAGIVRATALTLLRSYASQTTLDAIRKGLKDEDPLVRIGAVRTLDALKPEHRLELARPLLGDPIRSVRIETVRMLASVPAEKLTDEQKKALDDAAAEYVAAELVNAERPGAHLNLGVFYSERRQLQEAEAAYRTALRLDPAFYPALVNLADLRRLQKRDAEGEALLHEAVKVAPDNASVHQSLGLLLVRLKRHDEAVASFKRAAELAPDSARYTYVYAVSLHSVGKPEAAIKELQQAHDRHPNHLEILVALITIHRAQGDRKTAILYAEKLAALNPEDQAVQQLLSQLRSTGEESRN